MKLFPTPITLKEANQFVASFHRHNKPTRGGLFAVGCSNDGGLQGVAIVGRPVARMLQDGFTAEVTRVCTMDGSQKGTCSFLYATCWRAARAMGYQKLITYTLQSETGISLNGAGWRIVHETKASKSGWNVPSRSRDWQPIYGQAKFRWEIS